MVGLFRVHFSNFLCLQCLLGIWKLVAGSIRNFLYVSFSVLYDIVIRFEHSCSLDWNRTKSLGNGVSNQFPWPAAIIIPRVPSVCVICSSWPILIKHPERVEYVTSPNLPSGPLTPSWFLRPHELKSLSFFFLLLRGSREGISWLTEYERGDPRGLPDWVWSWEMTSRRLKTTAAPPLIVFSPGYRVYFCLSPRLLLLSIIWQGGAWTPPLSSKSSLPSFEGPVNSQAAEFICPSPFFSTFKIPGK